MSTLLDAISAGDLRQVRAIVATDPQAAMTRGADGVSPVLRCLYSGRLDLAEAVLDAGPELDLFDAAGLGDIAVLTRLLATGADVSAYSADGFTALHLAAFFDAPYAAALLLRAGADPEAVADNEMRVRPLHSALAGRSSGVVAALLAAGVEIDVTQQHGYTPLMAAAQSGDGELVELLLACGADGRRVSDDGRTAADMATEAGHDPLIERLRNLAH